MQTIKLNWINGALVGVILLLLVSALLFQFMRPSSIEVVEKASEIPKLPKGAFTLKTEDYQAIGPPFLTLKFSPMALQVPDLKRYLIYYGKNDRPDADPANQKMNFGFLGVKGSVSALANQPIYIMYDKNDPKVKYKFSPGNAVTTLWFEAKLMPNGDVSISASMRNEAGEVVHEPPANAEFILKPRSQVRSDTEDKRLGEFRIDGTLLSRQGAKWYGIDKFMERHGGEEYKEMATKQRIDFGTPGNAYSVYVGPDTVLAWIDGKWKEVKPGKDSVKYVILTVNKIEDRIMKLDLWDVDGDKTSINLIKSMETWVPDTIQKEFVFIGARTRSQFLFEINKERMTLSPLDWLIKTDKGWKKLTTAQDIDDYVERKISGPMFVFDGVEKRDGKQVLLGTLFNKARTEMKTVEIPMQQGATLTEPKKENKKIFPAVTELEEDEEEDEHESNEEIDPEKLREKLMERLKEKGKDMITTPPRPGERNQ